MWFIGVEVEQETSAPPPKKNPGSAPEVRDPASTGKEKGMKLTVPETFIYTNKYSKTEILAFCY